MAGMATVVEHIILDKILRSNAPLSAKGDFGQGAFVLSVFCMTLGFGFLIYGAHIWLAQTYAPDVAALATGGLSLALALVVGVGAYALRRWRRAGFTKKRGEIVKSLEDAVSSLDDQFGGPIRENPKTAVLLATIAGFVLEDRVF